MRSYRSPAYYVGSGATVVALGQAVETDTPRQLRTGIAPARETDTALTLRVAQFPTVVAVAHSAPDTANADTFTATIPASAQVGDLLILHAHNNSTLLFNQPSGVTGWDELYHASDSTVVANAIWQKVCAAGDPGATVTVTIEGMQNRLGALTVLVVRHGLVDVIGAVADTFADAAELVAATNITQGYDDEAILYIGGGISLGTTSPTNEPSATAPTNYTELSETRTARASNSNLLLHYASRRVAGGAGATRAGGPAATSQTMTSSFAFLLSLRPLAGTKAITGLASEADSAFVMSALTGGDSVPIGLASETDSTLELTRSKAMANGQPSEADVVQPAGRAKSKTLGLLSESDLPLATGRRKAKSTGLATSAESALVVTKADPIHRGIGLLTETDAVLAPSRLKRRGLGLVAETETAQPTGRTKRKTLGLLIETDSVLAAARRKSRTTGQLTEADAALTSARSKRRAPGLATETHVVLTLGCTKRKTLGLVSETDAGLSLGRLSRTALGLVTENDMALPVSSSDAIQVVLGQPSETDTGLGTGRAKRKALGLVIETDTGLVLSLANRRTIALANESDAALATGRVKRRMLGVASETTAALPPARLRSRSLGQLAELAQAQELGRLSAKGLGIAATADDPLAVSAAVSTGPRRDVVVQVSRGRVHLVSVSVRQHALRAQAQDRYATGRMASARTMGTGVDTRTVSVSLVREEVLTE